MSVFPLSVMKRLLRSGGNERVSKSAAIELNAVIESIGEKITERAVKLAKERGVKTISERDIRVAAKDLYGNKFQW